jgi:hypothetical protein
MIVLRTTQRGERVVRLPSGGAALERCAHEPWPSWAQPMGASLAFLETTLGPDPASPEGRLEAVRAELAALRETIERGGVREPSAAEADPEAIASLLGELGYEIEG